MFRKRYTGDGRVGQERDEQLHALLTNWRGVEPGVNFDAGIWRRIREEMIQETRLGWFAGLLQEWILPHPALVTALAASVAIMIGLLTGVASGIQPRHTGASPLVHGQTLAGAYMALSAGEMQ